MHSLPSVEEETVDLDITLGMMARSKSVGAQASPLNSMKFVALLSGGKDSCFNISHCQKNGHQLMAAASLRPHEGIGERWTLSKIQTA
jgi:hypothetical protein